MKEPQERSPRRTFLIGACLLFGVPIVLCAGVMTWYFGRQSVAAGKVQQRIEDLSQRGEPVDDESMQLCYEVATSNKNTERWVALRELLETSLFNESARDMPFHGAVDEDNQEIIVPLPGEDWPNRKAVDDFLQTWQAELKTIHELAEAEYVNIGKPLRRPIEFRSVATLLPDTQHIRTMARLLQLEHAVATFDGDQQRAYECIRACRGLERSTYGEPLIISQLIGRAVAGLAGEMIQTSVQLDQLSDEQMDDVAENFPTFGKLYELYELSIRGERAMMLPLFSNPQQANDIMELDSISGANLLTKTRASDALYYLERIDSFLSLPNDDMQAFRNAAKRATDRLENDARNAGMLETMDRAMSYMLIPAVGFYTEAIVRQAEHDNLAKLAMAVRKFRHQFDRWPQSLNELSRIGVDASQLRAANWPFGYRVEPSGAAVLWGINPTTQLTLPSQPPETDGENERNAAWVWRLKP